MHNIVCMFAPVQVQHHMEVDLKSLLDKLPEGWVDTIRDGLDRKYSTGYIGMVVRGVRWNKEIADAVVALAEKYQRELADMQNRVEALTSTGTSA